MPSMPSPLRVQGIVERLQRIYEDDDLIFGVRVLPRLGMRITVTLPDSDDAGLMFNVDQLDNGAHGIRENALARINAYRDGVAYQAPPPKPGLTYGDVMTYGEVN